MLSSTGDSDDETTVSEMMDTNLTDGLLPVEEKQ
jgi:hypothetical protein